MKQFIRFLNLFGPFLGLIVVYLIFVVSIRNESDRSAFLSMYNTKTVLQQAVVIGIAALGATLIIISAGIDLSVGSMVALGTVVTAQVLRHYGAQGTQVGVMDALLAASVCAIVCGLCGFLNGFMTAVFGIVPFIVTLGTMQIFRGAAKKFAGQTTVNAPQSWLRDLMIVEPTRGAWWSVAPGLWLMLALLLLVWLMLRYTTFGRHIFAVGSNQATARLCGINVTMTRIWVYAIGGLMAGISAILSFSKLNLGDPNGSIGFELDVIAAVVIGGGSFNGGEGSVVGSIIGAVIIALLRNGCLMVGLQDYIQNIVIGSIIIVAVGIDQLKHKRLA